jgi:flavin-dependent dehydrogenase
MLPKQDKYDVTIIGGGWAGQALARQLHRRMPKLQILVLDGSRSFGWKVGEATVDLCAHYLLQRLGLSTYLYRNHLPKNGLRFFFNDEKASRPLPEVSEVGSTFLPPTPTFQLNRQRFDSDLRQMNVDAGIECLLGVVCQNVNLGENGEPHAIHCRDDESQDRWFQTRWLVDASGRRRFLGRKLGLHSEKNVRRHCAVWGRFKGTTDMDALGDDAWRKRVSYTARFLSTVHFAGWGYWIWFIPLSDNLMSIGVVSSKEMVGQPPIKKEEFLAFVRNHCAAKQVLGNGELVDFMAYPQLAYRCHTLYSADRWAATGFAGMFQDPYWSLGGDTISLGNDYITDLVEKDLIERVPRQMIKIVAAQYNSSMQRFYDRTKVWMDGAYASMGSFNLFSIRYVYELCIYYLDYVWSFMCKEHLAEKSAERTRLADHFFELEIMLRDQVEEAVVAALKNGLYYADNASGSFTGVANFVSPFIFQIGQAGLWNWRLEMMLKIWLFTYLKITETKLGFRNLAEREIVQDILTLPRILELHPIGPKDQDWLMSELSKTIASQLEAEFGVRPSLEVSADHLAGDRIVLRNLSSKATSPELSAKMQARCDELWSRKRPYDQLPNQMRQLFRAFRNRGPMICAPAPSKTGYQGEKLAAGPG